MTTEPSGAATPATPSPGPPAGLRARVVTMTQRLVAWSQRRAAKRSPATERLLMLAAVILFVGATAIAYANLPDPRPPIRWLPLVAVTVFSVPGISILNAVEYRISGAILGHPIRFGEAFRVSVLASAVNQLPVPGAALVRIRALKRTGSTYGRATGSTAAVGLAWIGTTALVSGLLQVPERWALGVVFAGAGLTLLVISFSLVRWQSRDRALGHMVRLIAVEVGALALTTLKFWAALYAIGLSVSVAQAAALALSIVVAAATGFFPGGLGIREVIAAGVGPLVGVPAGSALVATAISRVTGMIAFSILATGVLVWGPRATPDPSEPAVVPHE